MFVGADAHIGPRSARRFYENLRRIRRFPTGRCGHRPLQTCKQYQNHKLSGKWQFCARRGRSGRGAAKKSRASARNITRLQAHLFAYFFWQDRKSRSAKQQLQCCRINGSLVKPDKRVDRVGRPSTACGGELLIGNGPDGCPARLSVLHCAGRWRPVTAEG